jgi:hypothetical protein
VEALAAPVCGGAYIRQTFSAGATFPAGQPVELMWQVDGPAETARTVCEQLTPGVLRVEAEDFAKVEGWVDETRDAPDHSGRAFVVDDVTARAVFTATIAEAGEYRVWARWYRTSPGGPPALLSIGDRTLPFSASAEANRWVWEMAGSASLTQGALTLALSRATPPGALYIPLFVDALLLSRDPTFDPARASEWASVANSGEKVVDADAPHLHLYTVTGAPGDYRCRVQAFAGDWLVDSQGQRGVWSDWIYFSIR